jgi:2-methylcitrate dehydratase PrpD
LGRRWRLQDPGLLLKLNPVCSAAHSVIEATAGLMRRSRASAAQIVQVRCSVPELVKISLVFDRPATPQEAQFSLPYAVACAVLHGCVRLEDLSPGEVTSLVKRSMMAKVEYESAPELSGDEARSRYPESARVAITLASGETIEAFCGEAYGMPGRPLTRDDLWKKFVTCMGYAGVPPEALAPAQELLTADAREPVAILRVIRPLLARLGHG